MHQQLSGSYKVRKLMCEVATCFRKAETKHVSVGILLLERLEDLRRREGGVLEKWRTLVELSCFHQPVMMRSEEQRERITDIASYFLRQEETCYVHLEFLERCTYSQFQ
jgi:hypothetical protein